MPIRCYLLSFVALFLCIAIISCGSDINYSTDKILIPNFNPKYCVDIPCNECTLRISSASFDKVQQTLNTQASHSLTLHLRFNISGKNLSNYSVVCFRVLHVDIEGHETAKVDIDVFGSDKNGILHKVILPTDTRIDFNLSLVFKKVVFLKERKLNIKAQVSFRNDIDGPIYSQYKNCSEILQIEGISILPAN